MARKDLRAGAAQAYIAESIDEVIPDLTTLSFTASAVAYDEALFKSIKGKLPTATNIQVVLGLVGEASEGGYAVTRCSPSSGNLTVAAGEGIQISVPLLNWPTGFENAGGVAIFLKIGASDFQLARIVAIDSQNELVAMVITRPRPNARTYDISLLQSIDDDPALGSDRANVTGYAFVEITPTTDVVVETFGAEQLTFRPNNAGDFPAVTARPTSVRFQGLINDTKSVIKASAGDFVKHTKSSIIFEEADQGFNSAVAVIRGLKPFRYVMPPDGQNNSEEVTFYGLQLENTEEVALNWSKTDQVAVPYSFSSSPNDYFLDDVSTVSARKRIDNS